MNLANHPEGTGEMPVSSHMKHPLSPSDIQKFYMIYRAYMQTHDMNSDHISEATPCRMLSRAKPTG